MSGIRTYTFDDLYVLIYVLQWRPSWISDRHKKQKICRGPSNDHSWAVWLQLTQWFLRRRLKCEMLIDGRRTTDDGRKVMTIAHMA